MKLPRVPAPNKPMPLDRFGKRIAFPKPTKPFKDLRKPTRMQEKINLNKLLKEESR